MFRLAGWTRRNKGFKENGKMIGLALMRLIERNSERLAQGLTEEIYRSERTTDFHKIPPKDLQVRATEIYRNLGEWLLQKTEHDIERWFRAMGARRAAEGISLPQFAWAVMLTRDHLWHFLEQECLSDSIIQLHGEIELQRHLNQFFDRAVYYGIIGYLDPVRQDSPKIKKSERFEELSLQMLQRLSLS
jgi:hypothetical protein